MANKEDKWERLSNMLDEYQVEEGLARNAINRALAEKEEKKKPFNWKWLAISMSAIVLVLAIVLPIFLYPKSVETLYFDNENVYVDTIEDMSVFVSENSLNIKTLELINGENQKYFIKETEELAYFTQKGIYVNDTGFDTIQLYVVIKPNSEFDFCERFSNLINSIECKTIAVSYGVMSKVNQNSIMACFNANGFKYYLDISTDGDIEEKLNFYVNLLAN